MKKKLSLLLLLLTFASAFSNPCQTRCANFCGSRGGTNILMVLACMDGCLAGCGGGGGTGPLPVSDMP